MHCRNIQVCVCKVIALLFLRASCSPTGAIDLQSSDQPGCHIPDPVVVQAEGVDIALHRGIISPQRRGSRIKPFQVVLVYRDLTCNFAAAQLTAHAGSPAIRGGSDGWQTYIQEPTVAVNIAARWGDPYPLDNGFGSTPDNRLVIFPGEATKADLVIVLTGPGQNVKPDAQHQPQLRFRIVASTRL